MTTQNEKTEKYIRSIGRRKTSAAEARLVSGTGKVIVNKKELKDYFPEEDFQNLIKDPFIVVGEENKYDTSVVVKGGGHVGQAESIRLAIARALVEINEDYRKSLKALGYLRRDSRRKERKKYGLLGARRAPQWSKR